MHVFVGHVDQLDTPRFDLCPEIKTYVNSFLLNYIFINSLVQNFRDGVSESQFSQVLNVELDQIIEVLADKCFLDVY